MNLPTREKLFAHLLVNTISDGECWIWQGARNASGYGRFQCRPLGIRTGYVHRFICEQAHGLVAGQVAIHSCDRPSCINPAHLRPGTAADNMQDAVAKGRHRAIRPDLARMAREGRFKNARLTPENVREIRHLIAYGMTQDKIARRFNIGSQAISKIKLGQRWSHVT